MKILVTGAQGQVGKEICQTANQADFTVIAAGRNELDITSESSVNDYITHHQPAIVINAAAYTAVDKAESENQQAYAINHDGAKNLAKVCSQLDIPLLHISTDYVFDGTKQESYTEEDPVSPLGIYGDSKWQGEEAVRKHLEKHIILRVAWVFGAHGNNFVKTMLRLANERDELGIVADQYGGPSPARNIAETLIALSKQFFQNGSLSWGTYHYCGAPKVSWYEFASEIFKQACENNLIDKKMKLNAITTAEYPTPAKRPANSMLNCSKLSKTFGIIMPDWKISLQQVLAELN